MVAVRVEYPHGPLARAELLAILVEAIVCLVGESQRTSSGLAGQVFSALGDINVRMISQGASEINIGMV